MHRARYNELKSTILKINAKHSHKFIDRNKLSEKDLKKYKRKIKSKILRERHRLFTKSIITTMIVLSLMIYVAKYLYNLFLNSF